MHSEADVRYGVAVDPGEGVTVGSGVDVVSLDGGKNGPSGGVRPIHLPMFASAFSSPFRADSGILHSLAEIRANAFSRPRSFGGAVADSSSWTFALCSFRCSLSRPRTAFWSLAGRSDLVCFAALETLLFTTRCFRRTFTRCAPLPPEPVCFEEIDWPPPWPPLANAVIGPATQRTRIDKTSKLAAAFRTTHTSSFMLDVQIRSPY